MTEEKFPMGSKWDCTMGSCKDCEKEGVLVFIPSGRGGIEGYCLEHINDHFDK